jgi:hypothetical protein
MLSYCESLRRRNWGEDTVKEFLRGVALFADLDDDDVDLVRVAREQSFRKRVNMIRAGEAGEAAFVLRRGEAETVLDKPTS